MTEIFHTNINSFYTIAEDAYRNMLAIQTRNRKPNSDKNGYIITFDPNHESLQNALVSIVFTCIFIEALTHQGITKRYNIQTFKKLQNTLLENKLEMIGITDSEAIEMTSQLRKVRNQIVHEKAYFDNGEIKIAEQEAKNAYLLRQKIKTFFEN
ncbi:hypothetical protein [Kordiimonas sp. SCSIO 12610]|uniref:hypothetical protein n=1 Tax=Kordiimonas sp. SCSIO 12610 TaxID=2829597 RepID=UPI00210CB4B1|nr:hypothetical protein [Kordiimonas sp. SCSIO 12610]UTW54017.1 hypothetical protein KFF44_09205 [Kordiimonas sp. SCSIO 12610]